MAETKKVLDHVRLHEDGDVHKLDHTGTYTDCGLSLFYAQYPVRLDGPPTCPVCLDPEPTP